MFPFSGFGPFDRSERKALLFALLFSCLFIVVIASARPHPRRIRISTNEFKVPTPVAPHKFPEPYLSSVHLLDRFRVRPERFRQVDFKNHSYGPYTSSDGTMIDLSLEHNELRLPKNSGWFALRDVYYKDVTGDGREEAIVWLSHVQCSSGSCNSGTDLFYIYTVRNGILKSIGRYETGTYTDGCGLKSLTLFNKQIMLALFGDCPKPAMDDPGEPKFIAGGFTIILSEFDGRRFTQKSTEYFVTPPTNVGGFEPMINIF